jgi:hypothetical protein
MECDESTTWQISRAEVIAPSLVSIAHCERGK